MLPYIGLAARVRGVVGVVNGFDTDHTDSIELLSSCQIAKRREAMVLPLTSEPLGISNPYVPLVSSKCSRRLRRQVSCGHTVGTCIILRVYGLEKAALKSLRASFARGWRRDPRSKFRTRSSSSHALSGSARPIQLDRAPHQSDNSPDSATGSGSDHHRFLAWQVEPARSTPYAPPVSPSRHV